MHGVQWLVASDKQLLSGAWPQLGLNLATLAKLEVLAGNAQLAATAVAEAITVLRQTHGPASEVHDVQMTARVMCVHSSDPHALLVSTLGQPWTYA